jgi:hypothetical protein
LHNTWLHHFCSSANIIRVTKSHVMTHTGEHGTHRWEEKITYGFRRKEWCKRDHLKGPVTDNRIILKHFLHSLGWCRLDSSDSVCEPVTGSLQHINNKFLKNRRNYLTTWENTVLSTGLGSIKLINYKPSTLKLHSSELLHTL